MEKRKLSTERQANLRANIVFSKEFFEIMDDDGTGGIELQELAQPLIALGLATDTAFVQKALKILNP
jgi:Ca2+-binding EF-hand superfamily protein